MVSYQDALKQSIEYFKGDELAATVFVGKYALTTPEGDVLEPTPDHMHRRLAKEFARIEQKYPNPLSEEEIYGWLKDFKYIVPQGSPMAGIGNPYQTVSLSNCFVIESPYDSYGGICKTDQEEAQIMKRRGGVGFDISTIRPRGVNTSNSSKTTDGIGVFLERFSNTCREVGQGGRRGALMLTISVHHPEIETFINIKRDLTKVTGANISIRLTDEFMKAVENKEHVELRFPVDSTSPTISKVVDANEIWDKIIDSAWSSAEPGLLFWDTIQKNTPSECYENFKATSTNPCGEILLNPYDSCRLMLINVLSFVKNPFSYDYSDFDQEKFFKCCMVAQRLMDDLVDLEIECIDRIIAKIEKDPEPKNVKQIEIDLWNNIKSCCVDGRRTGLGLTAVGDCLAALNIRYGSTSSIEEINNIYELLAEGAYCSTIELAKERGAFPAFDYEKEKEHPFLNQIFDITKTYYRDQWAQTGRRNIALTTTAPAGSVSVLTQTTSGIEPAFQVIYKRRRKITTADKDARVDFVDDMGDKWQEYEVYHPGFKKWMEITGKNNIEQSPYWKAMANDLDWVAKIDMQAAAQKWVCHSISNTTNIPKETSRDVVKDIYMRGWKSGCKGVTIYRDGCRDGVLLNITGSLDATTFDEHHAPKRPPELVCDVVHTTVYGDKWIFFVGKMDERPYEIMGGLSKYVGIPKRVKHGKIIKYSGRPNAQYDFHYDFEIGPEDEAIVKDINMAFENATNAAFTRTVSLALRHGVPIQYITEQLIKGSEKDDDLFSFSKAVSRVLKNYIKDGTKIDGKQCPNCSSSELSYQEGCLSCKACGYSKCG